MLNLPPPFPNLPSNPRRKGPSSPPSYRSVRWPETVEKIRHFGAPKSQENGNGKKWRLGNGNKKFFLSFGRLERSRNGKPEVGKKMGKGGRPRNFERPAAINRKEENRKYSPFLWPRKIYESVVVRPTEKGKKGRHPSSRISPSPPPSSRLDLPNRRSLWHLLLRS